ncbi:MAG: hypothetical protein ABWX90_01390 [Candidatus Saccharimonadales bacterium]
MQRHLHSIPREVPEATVTLRKLTGDYGSDNASDRTLRKKFGSAVYYLHASNMYGINQLDQLADPIEDVGGGLLACYDGLRSVSIERRKSVRGRLGSAALEMRTLACFKTIDSSGMRNRYLRQFDTSIGTLLPYVGVELDEDLTIKPIRDVLNGELSNDDDFSSQWTAQRIVG